MEGSVGYERRGSVGIATIQFPERLNVLSMDVRAGLRSAFDTVAKDPGVRALVLTGSGRAFCAGNDVRLLDVEFAEARQDIADTLALFCEPENLAVPVIAAVNGFALGGGFELALGCDLIIAARSATFGTPEIKIGAAAGFAMMRLPELLGKHRAMQLFMLGDRIDAETALDWGIANKVVDDDKLMDEAIALAEVIAEGAPLSAQLYKRVVNRAVGSEEILLAVEANAGLFTTKDQAEGRQAFLEKRSPRFRGE